jgi:hypothetical protein
MQRRESVDSQPVRTARPRGRGTVACYSCRARKVRCDVHKRHPCMHCSLDDTPCEIAERNLKSQIWKEPYSPDTWPIAKGRRKSKAKRYDSETYGKPPTTTRRDRFREGKIVTPSSTVSTPSTSGLNIVGNPLENAGSGQLDSLEAFCFESFEESDLMSLLGNIPSGKKSPEYMQLPDPNTSHDYQTRLRWSRYNATTDQVLAKTTPIQPRSKTPNIVPTFAKSPINPSEVLFLHLSFLETTNLPSLSTQDLNYMESQCCLRVPVKEILDVFLRHYFLYVHPLIPLLDEGDFWAMYRAYPQNPNSHRPKFPLLVFQAMLFAACSFVPSETITALGYDSHRAARRTFYNRAKTLFDLGVESASHILCQAALLMSYWMTPLAAVATKSNSAWLQIAILKVKQYEAECVDSRIQDEQSAASKKKLAKRLQWCCITRDYMMSIALRRTPRINRQIHDLENLPELVQADFAGEIDGSVVYSPNTKQILIEIYIYLCRLCMELTSVANVIFPFERGSDWDAIIGTERLSDINGCIDSLSRWYGATRSSLDELLRLKGIDNLNLKPYEFVHFYAQILFIYYQ